MSGWPWPLDGVQAWFEDLWSWIGEAATSAVSSVSTWINDSASWLFTQVREGWSWIVDQVSTVVGDAQRVLGEAFASLSGSVMAALAAVSSGVMDVGTWLFDQLSTGIQALTNSLSSFADTVGSTLSGILSQVADTVQNVGGWLSSTIWGWVDGALRWASDTFLWLRDEITNTGSWIITEVGTAFDGAFTAVGDVISGVFSKPLENFGSFFKLLAEIPATFDPGAFLADAVDYIADVMAMATRAFTPSSPRTPEEALTVAWDTINEATSIYMTQATSMIIAEAASLGQVDVAPAAFLHTPQLEAASKLVGELYSVMAEASLVTQVRQYYMRAFTPMIPPTPDLVRMVVREAFVPAMVIKAPDVFASFMAFSGFSQEWSDRYWTAHFEPIALTQAYANLWRGLWDKEDFMYALFIADVHPMWREDIYNVAFRAPTVRELGYGFDTGEYSVEDIVKYRRWGGLSPEDAEKAGRAMVAYRTEAEREALRREAIADFVAYLDNEEELRANLSAIGGRPGIVELWVTRADFRRRRDLVLDLARDSVNQFVKGWIQEEQLRNDLRELGVVAEGREKMIEEANTRKLRYVREATVEKKKQIPVSRVRKARDLGLIGDEEYVLRLVDHDYTEVDARLDLAIELTPRPITPEEIERRQRTITSRLERARRRWEIRLARVEAQIELSALQRDDAETLRDETLDVIDAQIAIIDDSIPLVTPENAKALSDKRVVLVQRRELAVARFTARINKLLEQYADLQEAKTLYERHRDEEIGEYEEELRIIGGVAG